MKSNHLRCPVSQMEFPQIYFRSLGTSVEFNYVGSTLKGYIGAFGSKLLKSLQFATLFMKITFSSWEEIWKFTTIYR
jgi:hypothetical protein